MTMLPNIANKKNLAVNGREYLIIEAGEGPLVGRVKQRSA